MGIFIFLFRLVILAALSCLCPPHYSVKQTLAYVAATSWNRSTRTPSCKGFRCKTLILQEVSVNDQIKVLNLTFALLQSFGCNILYKHCFDKFSARWSPITALVCKLL